LGCRRPRADAEWTLVYVLMYTIWSRGGFNFQMRQLENWSLRKGALGRTKIARYQEAILAGRPSDGGTFYDCGKAIAPSVAQSVVIEGRDRRALEPSSQHDLSRVGAEFERLRLPTETRTAIAGSDVKRLAGARNSVTSRRVFT
jgi:hypothetical protein